MLYQRCVEGVFDLEPANERGSNYVVAAVMYFGSFGLETRKVRFETLLQGHPYYKQVVVVFLVLLAGGVLRHEGLSYLLESVECSGFEEVEPVRS